MSGVRINGRVALVAVVALILFAPGTWWLRLLMWTPLVAVAAAVGVARGTAVRHLRSITANLADSAELQTPAVLLTDDADAWGTITKVRWLRPFALRVAGRGTLLSLPDNGVGFFPSLVPTLAGWDPILLPRPDLAAVDVTIDLDSDGDPADTGMCLIIAKDLRKLRVDLPENAIALSAALGIPLERAVDWDMNIFAGTPSSRFPDRDKALQWTLHPETEFPDDEFDPTHRLPLSDRTITPEEIGLLGDAAFRSSHEEHGEAIDWSEPAERPLDDELVMLLAYGENPLPQVGIDGERLGDAGWYSDPRAPGVRVRFFDGARWTDQVAADPRPAAGRAGSGPDAPTS